MSRAIRILVLEDDTDMRELLKEVLSERGYEVVAAGGGEEALKRARTESFDLIIADIRMEGITGLDAIEQAKEHQPDLGSIVISGYASEEETLRAVRLNVGGYLKKPFKMQQLLHQINEFVTQKTAERRRFEEHKTLREALLWSLEGMGTLGEQLYRGKVRRSADLASGLASRLQQSGEASGQTRAAAILNQLEHLAGLKMPVEVAEQLLPLPVLRQALLQAGQTEREVSAFAASVIRPLGPDDPLPSAESLPPNTDSRLRDAYRDWLLHGDQEIEAERGDESSGIGLLGLARALEQARNYEEAKKAYREVVDGGRGGADTVSAWLGLARVALAQRERGLLQESITQSLNVAEGLGPVTLALAQLQGAELLDRGNHPATEKLLSRAVASLRAVHLEVPYARGVLRLARRGDKVPPRALEEALTILGDPQNLPDVFESLGQVLPDLLDMAARGGGEKAQRLAARLARDYPHDVARLLQRERLQTEAKGFLLSVLESGDGTVASDVLQLLAADPDPSIKARALRLGEGAAAPPVLRVYSLGSQEVYVGDQQIEESDWKSLKVKNLFFYLASQRGKPAHVDTLMEEFWPGPVENARKNLNSAVSSIRKSLRGSQDESWDPVPRHKDSLSLDTRLVLWHDFEELQKAYEAGRAAQKSGQPEQAVSHFRRVARLYRGPYLEGCYMEWALTIRSATERLAGEALDHLVEHCLATQSYKEALEYAIRLLQLHPDKQEAHHAKMRAHVGLGQPELAIKQYESCARMLATEYGVEPNTDLLRTYHQARYGLGDASTQLIG
jgi:two-component SAPR family response regulator